MQAVRTLKAFGRVCCSLSDCSTLNYPFILLPQFRQRDNRWAAILPRHMPSQELRYVLQHARCNGILLFYLLLCKIGLAYLTVRVGGQYQVVLESENRRTR